MSIVAPPPQVRMVAVQHARVFSTQCVLLCGAMLLPTACYSGLSDLPEPWDNTNAGTEAEDSGSEGGGDADGDADGADDNADADPDGGDAGDTASAGDDAGTGSDGGSADPTSADGGSADPTSADGGSADTGSADGASADSGSADGATADDGAVDDGGGADEVPDNEFCMEVAGSDPAWSDLEDEILVIVNQRRSEGANCGSAGNFGATGPLTMIPALRCSARVHSKQMVEENFFDHTTPWGETPWDRMAAAGYSYSTAGENIAAGNSTAASTMQQWMDSDGHCSNIMSPDFTEIGVGYFPGGGYGHYWTQNFGSP